MTSHRHACPRESDVLELIAIGQWPARADLSLTGHVAACPICRDLARVSLALSRVNDATFRDVQVPDASTVWYRADARRRQERARRAVRPVTLAFAATVLCLIGVTWGGWLLVRSSLAAWWQAVPSWRPSAAPLSALLPTWQVDPWWGWAAAALVGWLAAVPILFYLTRVADRGHEVRDH